LQLQPKKSSSKTQDLNESSDYPTEEPGSVPEVSVTPSTIVLEGSQGDGTQGDGNQGDGNQGDKDGDGIDIPSSPQTHIALPGTPGSNTDGSSYSSTSSSRGLLTSSSPPRDDPTTTSTTDPDKTDTEDLSPLSEG